MVLTASFARSCILGFNEKVLRSAICYEAERGYQNAFGRNMKFSNFLQTNFLRLHSRSKHKSAQKILEEINGYGTANLSDRSNILNRVSVLMGYSNVDDLFENEKSLKECEVDLKEMIQEFDIPFNCKRFPSIILGTSSVVELYDDVVSQSERMNVFISERHKSFLPDSFDDERWVEPGNLNETLASIGSTNPEVGSNVSKDEVLEIFPSYTHYIDSQANSKLTFVSKLNECNQNEGHTSQSEALSDFIFDKPIDSVLNISSRHCRQLQKCGFHTLRKLLHHFPRTYADLQNAQGEIIDGQYLLFFGKILSSRGIKASSSFAFVEVVVLCEVKKNKSISMEKQKVHVHLKKFFRGTRFTNQPFLKALQAKYREGDWVCISGKVKKMNIHGHYEMREYNIDMLEEENERMSSESLPYPIYPSSGGLKSSFLKGVISRALKALPSSIDPIPCDILEEFNLFSLYDAYMGIHHPKDLTEADLARKRFIFDEFFYLQLGRLFQMLEAVHTNIEKDVLLERYRELQLNVVPIDEWSPQTKKFLEALPYALTSGQLNAVSEIIWDLRSSVPMNRLLQGDVGCGKTIVAFLSCMEVIGSGYQAALMVPTELLANQHYSLVLSYLDNINDKQYKPSVALLTGSTSLKESRIIRKGLKTGEISFVIGTHSLIADSIEFAALRIAVIDEQHRFGVLQRGKFNSKLYSISTSLQNYHGAASEKSHMAPHVLSMSATPIPRTLALALYGDMSLTQITDVPPGRMPVDTLTLEGNNLGMESVYQMMHDELQKRGRIFIVYPIIDESEQLPQLHAASPDLESISKKFNDYNCGLLHGRMKSDEKDEVLEHFRSGKIDILLSTQVIEIGVDIPDASMMVVMNAERFGIAQLHQLRGRVGRGIRKSKCIFLTSSSAALERLKVLEQSSDGFYLANIDLATRGPGNLLGKKQSGHLPEFPIARLEIDGNILQEAHLAALKLLAASHDLERFPKLKAELSMRQPLCLLGD